MRVRLSDEHREILFGKLAEKGLTTEGVGVAMAVSARLVSDWRRGKYTMSQGHFHALTALAGIKHEELDHELLSSWWHNADAGKLGAVARLNKYGELGTPEGRQKGGRNSYLNRKESSDDIFTPKTITEPGYSDRFAEFIGILIGDGNLTKYQVAIASNTVDDREYILFVEALIRELFGIVPRVSSRKNVNCTMIVTSSVKLVEYLKQHGVIEGHKLRQNLDIPPWILGDTTYSMAVLRGIFDTDGGIFLERHKINGKLYCYPRLSFVSMSYRLRASINQILADLDFSPKIRNNRSVNLEKRSDIKRYFELIGSSNPKHLNRWEQFGGVG